MTMKTLKRILIGLYLAYSIATDTIVVVTALYFVTRGIH